jgi:exonuclease III
METTANTNFEYLKGITFSAQNCNSLNMTGSTKQNQIIKVEALAGLKSDIIFVSDLRLGNKNTTGSIGEISRMFLMNSGGMYNLLSNSTQNKRGVGIVYKKGLALNVIRTALDPEENFLVALVELNNNMLILASIYGPNVHNPYFFQLLYRELKAMGDHPIVIGGDFNATFSKDTVEFNIDCIAMNDVPNIRHSNYINEFCEALNLMDPYRFLYPNKKEFSYRPFGDKRKNRSRIDFFLISNELLNTKFECSISPALLASCFDHKPIFLSFLNNGNGARLGKKSLLYLRVL